MNPSKNNGNLRADFASEDIEVSAERTAHATLKHGKRVLEQKLAERTQELNRSLVDVRSLTAALDAALDLRLLLAADADAETILSAFLRLRRIAEDRHYLACFRLRRWLETQFVAHVRLDRSQPRREIPVRLEARSYRELCARCAFEAAAGDRVTPWARVHVVPAEARLIALG